MNKNNKPTVVPIQPSWEEMSKMLVVLSQSPSSDNVKYAHKEIVKMGVHLDELERAALTVVEEVTS